MNYGASFDARSADGTHAHVQPGVPHPPAGAIVVPDAHLLFNADFHRSGVDLVLSKDDHEYVVHDYFKGEKRTALASPDGAHLTGDIVNALTGQVDYAQAAGAPDAGKIIGHVTKLAGSATVIRNGVSIILNMGDNVEKNDVVQSGSNTTLGITFIDGTVFGLSSNARMVLNEMVYDPNGSNNSSLISLVAGTISFVAGETAKHGDMKIDTPVATMGIRGTAVLVEIDFSAATGGSPDAKFQVLVEPDGTTGSYILYDKTTLAQLAVVNQAGQQIDINQNGISITNTPLSAEVQKLINDVFTLKFTDLWNQHPTTSTAQNDTITPQSQGLGLFKVVDASGIVLATYYSLGGNDKTVKISTDPTILFPHINIPPTIVAIGGTLEGAGGRGETSIDIISGEIRFVDPNPGDAPTATTTFSSFALLDANHNDITSTVTPQQLAAIQAVETSLVLVPDPGNNNNGTVAWTYSIEDSKFGFLGPGQTLTLTYLAQVANNAAPPFDAVVSAPITITIIGEQIPTIATTSSSVAELPGTNNATDDHASGTITFTDADPSARPLISTQFTSFSYQNAAHADVTASLTAQQKAAVAAVEASLVLTPASTNANNGSVGWSYDVADSKLDFLAAGETLTLTYTATVSEGPNNSVTEPITVTLTGTNDAPTLATTSGAMVESPATGSGSIDHATGTIVFADADLTDRPQVGTQLTSFTYQNAADQNVTSSLTAQQQADVAALEASLVLTPSSANTNNGSIGWSFDVADSKLDFLAAGDVLTLNYLAAVSDGHGGSASQPLTVTITGSNDQPIIVGETNPLVQNVVVVGSGTPSILGQGINTNSTGLPTETFDSQAAGSLADNGAGHGNFFSAALDATFSGSGNAGVVNGSSGVTGAPFIGPLPGSADATNYLSIGAGGTETIAFAHEENAFGLYWGSVDAYNTIDFYNGTTLVASFAGTDVSPLFANGSQGSFSSNGYVEFLGLAPFDKVVLGSGNANAFEIDNISAGAVHAGLAAPMTGTLTVSDADIGDSLTTSVSGNATVEYNGSTALPGNIDFAALATASAIKFDSTTSDGGAQVLDWTYDPTAANLDFLKAGDTLTITYQAQVSDGHGSIGSQPLIVSIVGTNPTASMSQFQVVSGTSQSDAFNNVGNGVTIFGGGGQDAFAFKPGFGSATIGDFNVGQDIINIDHTLSASVSALLASAQPIDGGQDTVITDAANDKITLLHVTPAQVQAHASDFHLV